ncbi:electron transport complex subunit RsxE [Fusobacterium sp. PH5-44]|uniref:electron transport complex subunit RsxE n=1 Tax=unclassified Fusobacterium TaxID=2648384 RepID=UPI003D1BF18D
MENKKSSFSVLVNGIIKENPVFVLMLGLCPTLGVTTSAMTGFSMGLAVIAVLSFSNLIISLLKKLIPDQVRIPAFIMVIASLVTIVEMLMAAYAGPLYDTLGIFLPLIVVNCIVLGRAESFASKNGIIDSFMDGIGSGMGFTLSLTIIGSIREFLGNGSIFNLRIIPESIGGIGIFKMAPGAFITIGTIMAILSHRRNKKQEG